MMDRKRNKTSARALIHRARLVHDELISYYVVGHGEGVVNNFLKLMSLQKTLQKH